MHRAPYVQGDPLNYPWIIMPFVYGCDVKKRWEKVGNRKKFGWLQERKKNKRDLLEGYYK